jgi:type II secretory pathway component PulF
MATADLAQFLTLSDQLVALVKAGVPLELGLPSRTSTAASACERIGAVVARRVGEGASVNQALEDQAVPAAYRSVVQLALVGSDLPAALAGASSVAQSQNEAWHAIRLSLRYPLVICGLAYVGLVLFCLFLVPHLEGMYANIGIRAGWGIMAATALRETLPYWVAVLPLALGLLLASLRWSSASGESSSFLAWIPGMSKAAAEEQSSRFAEALAGHLEAGSPLPEALQTASSAWDNESFEQGTRDLAVSLHRGEGATDNTPFALRLPPLLRWALWHADDTVGRSRALRMAAELYRESAERRVQKLRVVAPIVTCLVIGGGVTLLYTLALFVPLAQLIQGLAG